MSTDIDEMTVQRLGGSCGAIVRGLDLTRPQSPDEIETILQAVALEDTLAHALEVWRDPETWRGMQLRGMAKDFSWEAQVDRYEDLYAAIMADLQLA